MHILITGGAGFIGSNLVDLLLENNHQLTIIDDLSTGKIATDNAVGSVSLDATNQYLAIYTGSIDTDRPKLVLGKQPGGSTPYGLGIYTGTSDADSSDGDTYNVLITKDVARLAGWDMSPGKLESGTVAVIDGNEGKIALGTGATTYTGGAGGITNPTPTANLFFVSASTNPIFFVGANFTFSLDGIGKLSFVFGLRPILGLV